MIESDPSLPVKAFDSPVTEIEADIVNSEPAVQISTPPSVSLVMQTAPFGEVSVVDRFFISVDSPQAKISSMNFLNFKFYFNRDFSRDLGKLKFDLMTDRYGKVEYQNYPENKLSDADFVEAISLKVNGPQIRFKTWFGLDFVHNEYTVIAKFPVKDLNFPLEFHHSISSL